MTETRAFKKPLFENFYNTFGLLALLFKIFCYLKICTKYFSSLTFSSLLPTIFLSRLIFLKGCCIFFFNNNLQISNLFFGILNF